MAHIVDLRSDTVTKPNKLMKHAMVNSALGDDVYGEDPTVNALESKVATLLGKQAALFLPTATMANLVAVMVHCNKRGSEVLVGSKAHIYKYEQGGASHVAGALLSTLENKPDGTFDLAEAEKRIRGSDIHEPVTTMIAIENTHNVCGGKVVPQDWIDAVGALCKKHSLALHMDGSRLMNASVQSGVPAERIVRDCDSVTLCFSKGLGAPAGAALAGSYHFIQQARRARKMVGGGMRQAGVLAAPALVALEHGLPALALDHKRADRLAQIIHGLFLKNFTVDVAGRHTNIVLVRIPDTSALTADVVLQRLAQVSRAETQVHISSVIHGLFLKNFTVDVAGRHTNIVLVRIPDTSALTADVVLQRLAQVSRAETQVHISSVIHGLFLKNFTVDVAGRHTNIVLVRIPDTSALTADVVLQRLAQVSRAETQGDCKTADDEGVIVKGSCFTPKLMRFVTHCDVTDEDLWLAIMKITYVFKELDAKYPVSQ